MGKKDKNTNNKNDKGEGEASLQRIAIVNEDRCKPKKCRQECKRNCPVVKIGKMCIEATPNSKVAWISETLCIGCGICIRRCPFEAITIRNLPTNLNSHITHRFGPNTFKLHRLPVPRAGQVLGLVGTNGIGKSTALSILSGKLKPNLGNYDNPPEWAEILSKYRGSELQNFFKHLLEDNLKAIIKQQYVDNLAKKREEIPIREFLFKNAHKDEVNETIHDLELTHLIDRKLGALSGGELQRFAIGLAITRTGNVYMYDEPSSYLDVSQRIKASQAIRKSIRDNKYIIVVEHDLAILDYMSDYVCVLYGQPSSFGVVTTPFSVREGINIFLDGYLPTENIILHQEPITFKVSTDSDLLPDEVKRLHFYTYPTISKTLGEFSLCVHEGDFSESQIIILLGKNGAGKSTFIKMLAGKLEPDNDDVELLKLSVSYKPQTIQATFQGTVKNLLQSKIRHSMVQPLFITDVIKPLQIENLYDQEVQNLSGGELQRVALVMALGKQADIYLIDEPSAHLDSIQRIIASRVIKRYILHAKKTAFVVEHDFIMATYLADRVIVFGGEVGVNCFATKPESLASGMNRFLKELEVTFRKDPTNYRPRINKLNSVKDKEQKLAGTYYLLDDY